MVVVVLVISVRVVHLVDVCLLWNSRADADSATGRIKSVVIVVVGVPNKETQTL